MDVIVALKQVKWEKSDKLPKIEYYRQENCGECGKPVILPDRGKLEEGKGDYPAEIRCVECVKETE